MPDDLFSLIRSRAPQEERTFLFLPDDRRITWGDLFEQSARFANVLVGLGVEPGDRVAAQVEKSAEAFLLYLACLRAGAVYLPLNTAYTLAEVEYFLSDAEPRLVVCTPERFATLAPLAEKLGVEQVLTLGADGRSGSLLERARTAPAEFVDVPRGGGDLAAILYTSGTTGRSKGAMLSHANLVSNAEALRQWWQFTGDDVLLHALPVFHTHGLFVAGNVALLAGAAMIFLPRFDPDEVFRFLPQATCMMGVPTFYVRLLADPRLDRAATAHVRLFVSGSAPLLAETHRDWLERTGHAIVERYGLTETSINTSNPCDGERIAGTVGLPLPGVEVRITHAERGTPIAPGEIGMIEVRGPNVFRGYWRMPEKTAEELRPDGFFITGDLGRIDERGYVHIVGRGKDLIISGGYNVYPKEVESEIDAIPGVEESAVIGVPHADFGEAVTAVVTLRPGAVVDESDILGALKERLAPYKRPKHVFFVEQLPRNAMGKIEKNALRQRYGAKEGAGD